MGALADDLDVRLSTMTGVIDQLEEKGLPRKISS
jgi:DNA-binding MarR family transcriptional regulator